MAFVDLHSSSFSSSYNAPALGIPNISKVAQSVQSQVNPAQFAILTFREIEAMRECPASEWRVYACISLHANPAGEAWPGRNRLAEMTGLLPDHVSRAVTALQERGLLVRCVRPSGLTHYSLPLHRTGPMAGLPNLVGNSDEPLPNLVDRTDHIPTDQRERAEPERTTPEPVEQAPLSPLLRSIKTPPPDALPESWIQEARTINPAIRDEQWEQSAERFLNLQRARGAVLIDWRPVWMNWAKQERPAKPVGNAPTADAPSRYSAWKPNEAQGAAPVSRDQAVASFERDMERLGAVKQPDGVWARPTTTISPKTTPAPLPRPVVSMVGLETPAPVPAVAVEIEPPPPQATEKHRFSPLHGLIAGLRNPAPEVSKPATVPWRRPLAAIIDPAELAEAEALLAAEIARKRGNPVGG